MYNKTRGNINQVQLVLEKNNNNQHNLFFFNQIMKYFNLTSLSCHSVIKDAYKKCTMLCTQCEKKLMLYTQNASWR